MVSYLEDYVIPMLIGRDAHRIEDIWQYLYRGAYWRRGPVGMTAIAAVDTALWDIKAKAANMPLYQLLGGRSRDRIMVYSHANGNAIQAVLDEVGHHRDLGYKAIRVQCGVPGLASTYGVSKGDKPYEPADSDLPSENVWSTEKYLNFIPKLFRAIRDQYGEDLHILHDVHHRLTPIEAARLGKELEPYHLFWMEDAVAAENQEGFRLIRQHTTTPLAVGEVFNSIHDCRELIEKQLIDYIRTSVSHVGGITQLRDGTIVALDTYIMPGERDGEGVGQLYTSSDDWKTVEGPIDVPFELPNHDFYGSTDDGGRPHAAQRLHHAGRRR